MKTILSFRVIIASFYFLSSLSPLSWGQDLNSYDFKVKPILEKKLDPETSNFVLGIAKGINNNVDSYTNLGYSFPNDKRLSNWSVTYDNTIRIMGHIQTRQINKAKKAMDYFIKNKAIRKIGWFYKEGKLRSRDGWIINIVDAAERRASGRGIEYIAHVGPNVYLGIAAVHLYKKTGLRRYLNFAKERWQLARDVQNDDPLDPNYGGIRMSPLGNPNNPIDQQVAFKKDYPSFYNFYNGEHAAGYKAFCGLMAWIDPVNKNKYEEGARLIEIWDQQIFNPENNLFYEGTTEKEYFDENIGERITPGIIPVYPLDTTALKLISYGVEGMEKFGAGTAEKSRATIEKEFSVTVSYKTPQGEKQIVSGYDFVGNDDRRKIILYEEGGRSTNKKFVRGVGREPLLSDEWSTWVALVDLRYASDYKKLGQTEKMTEALLRYYANAVEEASKSALKVSDTFMFPYAHPIPYSLNKPVGFGWNTQLTSQSIIGGQARLLGLLRFDPYQPEGGAFAVTLPLKMPKVNVNPRIPDKSNGGVFTEAEDFVNEAWRQVNLAQKHAANEELRWKKALQILDQMSSEHPDWIQIAQIQNSVAGQTKDKFPLMGRGGVTIKDIEPIYRKYWALYHMGTAEFIRVMAYSGLANLSDNKGLIEASKAYRKKMDESAQNIIKRYSFAQAYDRGGWFWQPIFSLSDYGNYDVSSLYNKTVKKKKKRKK
ncbi:MAG: hypothetical protein ACKVQC_02125 [Elusimicrobiota bacterium]